jgi:phosphomannomutase
MSILDPGIFKAYDIRGVHGRDIDEGGAERIGRGFAHVIADLSGKPVDELTLGLGRDMRLQAPAMAQAFAAGMTAAGADVVDAGQIGTEMLYYLVGSRELDGGIMCTASHNPKAYTGAKLVREGALPLSGDAGIPELKEYALTGVDALPEASERGTITQADIYDEFQDYVLRFIDPAKIKPLKVVVDGGNGMSGPMCGPLLRKLGLELIETYFAPNGDFPGHEPNPLLPENRQFTIDEVIKQGADLGIAWDGDADRCFFVDDKGEFVDGDFLTAILAQTLLKKHPGETILYDVRASRAVADTVTAAGGTALENRVGHAFFKSRMRTEGGIFGGEVSGHYYFQEFFCADSGTIPALLILEELSESGAKLSELVARYRSKYFISGEINSEVADQAAKIKEIKKRFADARLGELDGISIDYDDWHFNVRSSNTEPLLRLCLESLVSVQDMERRRDQVLALIRA